MDANAIGHFVANVIRQTGNPAVLLPSVVLGIYAARLLAGRFFLHALAMSLVTHVMIVVLAKLEVYESTLRFKSWGGAFASLWLEHVAAFLIVAFLSWLLAGIVRRRMK